MFFSGAASGLCQRELVEAHGSHWLVCLMLDSTAAEHEAKSRLRFALAVKCDADGRVKLPSEGAQLIQFAPSFLVPLAEQLAARELAAREVK